MALKEISIGLGILAGAAGVTNSGYGLYQSLVVEPNRNLELNQAILEQSPLVVETIEIRPDPGMAMRVEVTVKVFPTGDILVESGARRQFVPFGLVATPVAMLGLWRDAYADTQIIGGVTYDVETVQYVETTRTLPEHRLERVRVFADGTVETAVIDARSNAIVSTRTESRALTEAEQAAIAASPYRKKIFRARE